ncbi:MAG: substrate-binding domain-containing protein, partial [Planctomycetota bacterium]
MKFQKFQMVPATLVAACCLLVSMGCEVRTRSNSGPKELATLDESTRPKIGFITNCVASFWVIAEKGVEKGAEEFNADAEVLMPQEGGAVTQKAMLEDLVSRGVDGIAITAIDPQNQTPLLDEIADQTRLICHDSDAPKSKRLCYIGMDNYDAGLMVGKILRRALPDGGKVAIFVGRVEQDNGRRRRQGTIDGLLDRPRNPDGFYSMNEVIKEDG